MAAEPLDQQQLAEWFKRWRKPLRQWLGKRGNIAWADLDDIVQEVFLRLVRYSNDSGLVVDNPQGYLFHIASNAANEWADKARYRKPHNDEWLVDLIDLVADQPQNQAEQIDLDVQVQKMLDQLPHRQGLIVLMHIWEGKSYYRIAFELKITTRVVLRELTRAYKALSLQYWDDPLHDSVRTKHFYPHHHHHSHRKPHG